MKELLERWAKLEPTRCEGVYRGEGVFSVYVHLGREERVYRIVHDLVESANAANSWLQAAVQEAIEARSWRWELTSPWRGDSHTYTRYWCDLDASTSELDRPVIGQEGESAAEALLSAYLTALEAQG
jgi:hypothetical protein